MSENDVKCRKNFSRNFKIFSLAKIIAAFYWKV